MADIINLRRIRKDKQRSEHEKQSDANRIKFGRTKAEKLLSKTEIKRDAKLLDGHKRDT